MAKIKIDLNAANSYYLKLIADNGEIIVWSEAYSSYQNAVRAAVWIKNNASLATIV